MAVTLSETAAAEAENHLLTVKRTLASLRVGVPLITDELQDPLYDPHANDRFTLENWGGPDTYLLSDKHNYDSYIIYYDQMSDPEFDAVAWLTDLKLRNYDDLIVKKSAFKPTWRGEVVADYTPSTELAHHGMENCPDLLTCESSSDDEDPELLAGECPLAPAETSIAPRPDGVSSLLCAGTRTELPDVRSLQRNAARPKSASRVVETHS
jgi:hypothetical protein